MKAKVYVKRSAKGSSAASTTKTALARRALNGKKRSSVSTKSSDPKKVTRVYFPWGEYLDYK